MRFRNAGIAPVNSLSAAVAVLEQQQQQFVTFFRFPFLVVRRLPLSLSLSAVAKRPNRLTSGSHAKC